MMPSQAPGTSSSQAPSSLLWPVVAFLLNSGQAGRSAIYRLTSLRSYLHLPPERVVKLASTSGPERGPRAAPVGLAEQIPLNAFVSTPAAAHVAVQGQRPGARVPRGQHVLRRARHDVRGPQHAAAGWTRPHQQHGRGRHAQRHLRVHLPQPALAACPRGQRAAAPTRRAIRARGRRGGRHGRDRVRRRQLLGDGDGAAVPARVQRRVGVRHDGPSNHPRLHQGLRGGPRRPRRAGGAPRRLLHGTSVPPRRHMPHHMLHDGSPSSEPRHPRAGSRVSTRTGGRRDAYSQGGEVRSAREDFLES